MVDILPDEIHAWHWLEQLIRNTASRFGFEEIRTPVLEPTGLIARGIGQLTDIVSKEMFAFERGDDQYVLRPEGTAPVVRSYIQHRLDQRGGIQKLYYIGPMFRAERPQKGRQRQFHQFGAEIIGSANPLADVESILFLLDVVRQTGLQHTVLNINSVGEPESRASYKRALQEYFGPFSHQLSEISQKRLETNPMRILDSKEPEDQAFIENAPLISNYLSNESIQHFERVKKLLDVHGIGFTVNPRLVRGLDYYTRTAFELTSSSVGSQDALGGGGRYDLLIEELGGTQTAAVGMAAGMERLLIACAAQNLIPEKTTRTDVYFVTRGEDAENIAAQLSRRLREEGLAVRTDLGGRSFKAQMKEADRLGTSIVVLIGEEESKSLHGKNASKNGFLTVKNLRTSSERTFPLQQIEGLVLFLKNEKFYQNQTYQPVTTGTAVAGKLVKSSVLLPEAVTRAFTTGKISSDSHYKRINEFLALENEFELKEPKLYLRLKEIKKEYREIRAFAKGKHIGSSKKIDPK